jgi:hypothetical protein
MNSSEDFNQDTLSTNSDREPVAASEAAGAVGDAPPSSVEAPAPNAPSIDVKSDVGPAAESGAAPKIPSPAPDGQSIVERPPVSLSLIPLVPGVRGEAPPPGNSFWRAAFEKRIQIGAMAAGLAIVGVGAFASVSYKAQQDQALVSQSSETQNLAETVKGLKTRLAAIDAAKHEDILDLRRSVAELKNGLAAHDSNAALAQFNTRADRLEHDEAAKHEEIADLRKTIAELKSSLAAAHDSSATLAQFNARADRVEHDEAMHNADFTARLEKLEKKVPAPTVAAVSQPPAASVPVPVALTKQPAPPVAANVSKETTGSIAPQTPIHGWFVREVHGNMALVEGPYGFRQIGPGDTLPGAGHVERIERRATGWTVVTDRGVISGGYGGGAYRAGAYGAFNGGYGPPEGEF